jgi:hypothetical protein
MGNLLQLLIEASIPDDIIDRFIKSGGRISLYYKGDNKIKKGWRSVQFIKKRRIKNINYVVAKDWGSANEDVINFQQELITNWNVLSKISKNLDGDIEDAIRNKRYVKIRYQGEEEDSPGVRYEVRPFAFGIRNNRKYIRAWVGKGKSVSGEKNSKKALPKWRLFRYDRISHWEVDGTENFSAPPNYRPKDGLGTDRAMSKVIVYSQFNEDVDLPESPFKKKKKNKKKTSNKKSNKKLQESAMVDALLDAVRIL